ncbi:MAG: DUF2071 domain-containing protein [Bacteroidia bacterium]|nr:DUF2071 domain-containing protein [Bacteroidia bacterium]
MSGRPFLTARWSRLILANYTLDPALLAPWMPAGTAHDLFDGRCYVSLVGFLFDDTRLLGVPVPFHQRFEEVNLRFYVVREADGVRRRASVFIRELVPKPAISWVANAVYGEHYRTVPMRHCWAEEGGQLRVSYDWKFRGRWNRLAVDAAAQAAPLQPGSEAEFITEHYWGYTRLDARRTGEYQVAHPRWELYPVQAWTVEVDAGALYGERFAWLSQAEPASVLLAEGSEVAVYPGKVIRE